MTSTPKTDLYNGHDASKMPGDVDLPRSEEIIWHKMKSDLDSMIPELRGTDTLLCPVCLRRLQRKDFNIEHVIPRQAVREDPPEIRATVPTNARSTLLLLCNKRLRVTSTIVVKNGCNGWKGKYYDNFIRAMLFKERDRLKISTRHQISMFVAGYLGMFRTYGYRVALSSSGLSMRRQFFSPNEFLEEIPLLCQMVLHADPIRDLNIDPSYWTDPIQISINGKTASISIRNNAINVPISFDPRVQFSRSTLVLPPRFERFKEDFPLFD